MAKADSDPENLNSESKRLSPGSLSGRATGRDYAGSGADTDRRSEISRGIVLSLIESDEWLADQRKIYLGNNCPEQISRPVYAFLMRLAANMSKSERQRLWPFANRLGEPSPDRRHAIYSQQAYRFADWAVRELLPLAASTSTADIDGLEKIAALRPIVDRASAISAANAAISLSNCPGSLFAVAATGAEICSAARLSPEPSDPGDGLRVDSGARAGLRAESSARAAIRASVFALSCGVDQEVLLAMQLSLLDQFCPLPLQLPSRSLGPKLANCSISK